MLNRSKSNRLVLALFLGLLLVLAGCSGSDSSANSKQDAAADGSVNPDLTSPDQFDLAQQTDGAEQPDVSQQEIGDDLFDGSDGQLDSAVEPDLSDIAVPKDLEQSLDGSDLLLNDGTDVASTDSADGSAPDLDKDTHVADLSDDIEADQGMPDSVGVPLPTGSVRIDLRLDGVSRSFVKLWTIGEGALTSGIATDTIGQIYTTVAGTLLVVNAAGKKQWSDNCTTYGGCNSVAVSGGLVFAGVENRGFVKFNAATGKELCHYTPGDLPGSAQASQFMVAGNYVIYGTGGGAVVAVIRQSDCGEVYRKSTPNGEKVGSVVADAGSNKLIISWDDAGGGKPSIVTYALSTGKQGCDYVNSEMFRTLIVKGWHIGGWSKLKASDIGDCSEKNGFSDGYGDVRDIGYDSVLDRLYVLTSNTSKFGLYILDASNFTELAYHTDFFDNKLLSLNKMGLGNQWAFVPDGATLADGRIRVIELTTPPVEFTSFEGGRVTRLGDRLIDGGLFLSQVQRGNVVNPDTPLIAYRVGKGAFVGHSFLWGNSNGNKYCADCLTELQYVELSCTEVTSTSWSCTLSHSYPDKIAAIVLAGFPAGTYNLVAPDSSPIKTGVSGEVELDGELLPGQTLKFDVLKQ